MIATEKDKEYMAIMDGVLEEAWEHGFGYEYEHERAALILCMLDRMRGRPHKDLNDEYYYQDGVQALREAAVKEKYAKEHCVEEKEKYAKEHCVEEKA